MLPPPASKEEAVPSPHTAPGSPPPSESNLNSPPSTCLHSRPVSPATQRCLPLLRCCHPGFTQGDTHPFTLTPRFPHTYTHTHTRTGEASFPALGWYPHSQHLTSPAEVPCSLLSSPLCTPSTLTLAWHRTDARKKQKRRRVQPAEWERGAQQGRPANAHPHPISHSYPG